MTKTKKIMITTDTIKQWMSKGHVALFGTALTLALGGEIIHDFSFALLVGVLIGTYSSIYIASPVSMWLTTLAPVSSNTPSTT